MVDAISSSLAGLTTASKKLDAAAARIANAGTDGSDTDLATEAVNLKLASIEYKANLKALDASREISDEVLKIFDKKV